MPSILPSRPGTLVSTRYISGLGLFFWTPLYILVGWAASSSSSGGGGADGADDASATGAGASSEAVSSQDAAWIALMMLGVSLGMALQTFGFQHAENLSHVSLWPCVRSFRSRAAPSSWCRRRRRHVAASARAPSRPRGLAVVAPAPREGGGAAAYELSRRVARVSPPRSTREF